jgi:hypothetical protein
MARLLPVIDAALDQRGHRGVNFVATELSCAGRQSPRPSMGGESVVASAPIEVRRSPRAASSGPTFSVTSVSSSSTMRSIRATRSVMRSRCALLRIGWIEAWRCFGVNLGKVVE